MTGAAPRKKVWYLQRLDLFADLSEEEVEEMAVLLHDHHVPAGVELLGRRERDRVYLVKEGAVRVDVGEGPNRATVALLGPGRLFGLSSAAGENAPAVAATTVVSSYVCIATWSKLVEVLTVRPPVLLRVMRSLAEQVFRIETWRARLGAKPPAARLAGLVLELADEFGEPGEGRRVLPFRLERADLARMVGTSRETASRVMAGFERAGWVGRDGGRIVVRDRQALAAEARGDHGGNRMTLAEGTDADPAGET